MAKGHRQLATSEEIKSLLLLHSLGISLAIGTFVFDLMMPLGVAAAVPYALLVLLSLRSPGYGITGFAAISATLLTGAGYLLSPPGGEPWKVLTNRALALFVIWVTAYLCFVQKRDQMRLIQSEKMASLGEMAAGIAHEVGNPLAALQGRIEMLELKLGSSEPDRTELQELTAIIAGLTDRMVRIIRGMRSLARDASSDPFQNASIGRLIDDVLELSREKLRELDIEVRRGRIDDRLDVPCREAEVGQVLMNLIRNATDAVRELPERWIQIGVSDAGASVEISVTDSGKGIPKEIQDKVMAPFFTTKEVGQGTGLGLTISKSVIERHSGALWLDGDCANTRFVISLPKVQGLSS